MMANPFGDPEVSTSDTNPFGDAQVGPASPEMVKKIAGPLGRKVADTVRKVLGTRDKGVDYSGVDDPSSQAAYSMISKPEDRTTYLKQKFGDGSVTKDSYGRDIVIQDGKKTSFLPISSGEEGSKNRLGSQIAGMAGQVLPTAGMVIGDIAGGVSTPAAVGLAGIGGAVGEGANKLIAAGLGLPTTQGPMETMSDVGQAGLSGMGMSGLGRGAGMLFKTALGPYGAGAALGPWPRTAAMEQERLALLQQTQEAGLRPNVGVYQPRAKISAAAQQAGYQTFGSDLPTINRPILERKATGLVEQAAPGAADVPASQINAGISRKVDATIAAAKTAADTAKTEAENILKTSSQRVGTLSTNVAESVKADRLAFGTQASELYKPVDVMLGKPVTPTNGLRETLKREMEANPLMKPNEVFQKQINDLPEFVTLQQMQSIRSTLYSESDFSSLNSGIPNRSRIALANAADAAFDKIASTQGKEAVQALRRADQFYKGGIKRFDDLSVQALVKDATQTGFVQPEAVAKTIAVPGQVDKLSRIRKVVSPDTYNQIGEARWNQVIQDSTDPITGEISGTRLTKNVSALQRPNEAGKSVFGELYGKRAPEIRARVDQVLAKEQEFGNLMKTDWMKAVKSDGPQSLQAADWLTKPENRIYLRKAIETFGKESTEAKSLLSYGARKMFDSMEVKATMGAGQVSNTELMGAPLQDTLNKYGKDYLNEFYGKDWTNAAHNFANMAEFATRKNPAISGMVGSAVYKLAPFTHKIPLLKTFLAGEYLSKPWVIKYLGEGLRGPGVDAAASMIRSGTIVEGRKVQKNISDTAGEAKAKAQSALQELQ